MKLLSYLINGEGRVGALLEGDRVLDLRDVPGVGLPTEIAGDMIRLIEAGDGTWEELRRALSTIDSTLLSKRSVAIADIEWLPPVRRPSKIVCVVTNNRALDSIKVRAPTDHPAFFIKPSSALIGHLQPIEIHKSYGLTHPEPELAVVIGKTIKRASEKEAAAAVFGYSIINDVTSVGLREEDSFCVRVFIPTEGHAEPQPTLVHTSYAGRYKGADTFAPMGPVLVTRDEIPDPSQLDIRCMVGNELIAADSLTNYIWSVAAALSHISRTTTLYPGDVVAMGTATGNSAARAAAGIPAVLKADLNGATKPVMISITGIGVLENSINTLEG